MVYRLASIAPEAKIITNDKAAVMTTPQQRMQVNDTKTGETAFLRMNEFGI